MLSEEQYKVETNQSVADALAAVEQKSFHVYVVDYKLPDGSGTDSIEMGCNSNPSYLGL